MNNKIGYIALLLSSLFLTGVAYSQSGNAQKAFDSLDREEQTVKPAKAPADDKREHVNTAPAKVHPAKEAVKADSASGVQNTAKGSAVKPKIVQSESKVTFLDSNGKTIKEIPILASTGTRNVLLDGSTYQMDVDEQTMAVTSGNGQYTAIIERISVGEDDQGAFESTCTFKYYNVKGEVLWQKDKFDINCLYNSPNILSGDGKRILYTIKDVKNESADIPIFKAVIYNEKGEELMDFGEFSDVYEQFITKNGEYGCFTYSKKEGYKYNTEVLFFDVRAKQTKTVESMGFNSISDDGKIQISKLLSEVEVHSDGVIRYWDNRKLKFDKKFNLLGQDELNLFSEDEIEKIKQIINEKSDDSIFREKVIYEYQFK